MYKAHYSYFLKYASFWEANSLKENNEQIKMTFSLIFFAWIGQ